MDEAIVIGIIIAFFISFIVFLILREVMCWYWKVNTIISLLEGIQASLHNLGQGQKSSSHAEPPPQLEICPFCGELSPKISPGCGICGKNKR